MQLAIFTVPVHIIWLGCLFFGMLIARKLEQYLARKVSEDSLDGSKIQNAVGADSPNKEKA